MAFNLGMDLTPDAHPVPIVSPYNPPPPVPGPTTQRQQVPRGSTLIVNMPGENPTAPAPPPKDHLKMNAILCIVCFWAFPFGIAALVRSCHVRKYVRDGPMWHARVTSTRAKKCGIATAVIGTLMLVVIIVVLVFTVGNVSI